MRIERGHRLARSGGDDRSSLHRLAVDRGGRKVEADLGPLFTVLDFDEHAVAHHDELFVVADHGFEPLGIHAIYPLAVRRCPELTATAAPVLECSVRKWWPLKSPHPPPAPPPRRARSPIAGRRGSPPPAARPTGRSTARSAGR